MTVRKFLRRTWDRYSKLGKGRKKKQKWRRATGRHNKIREKKKGAQIKVMIGFKNDNTKRNLIKEKAPVYIYNIKDLEKVGKEQIAVLANVGKKKKIEIGKMAKEKGIVISNLNVDRMMKRLDVKKTEEKKEVARKSKSKKIVEKKK